MIVSEQDTTVGMDEMWSYVGNKSNQRWLWHAIDRDTGKVLAYVCGRRQDEVFLKLKGLLESFGITCFYTDDWGIYYTPFRPRKARYWEAKHAENRTQTFNAADTNQAACPQDDLFFNKTKCMVSSLDYS